MSSNMSIFECRVCYQIYNRDDRKPKFLTCHHTFCLACISSLDRTNSAIRCPCCHEMTHVRSHQIDVVLQTNGELFDFMDAVQNLNNRLLASLANSWCRVCKQMATLDCEESKHRFERLEDDLAENLKKALTDRQTTIRNWEGATLQREIMSSILTSTQVTVNKLKTHIDNLVDKNRRILLDMGRKLVEVKEGNNIEPSSFDGAIEEQRATKSGRDLVVAETVVQRILSLDGVPFTVALQSHKPELSWTNGLRGVLNWESTPVETALTHSEAWKLLGYLTLNFSFSSTSDTVQ